MTETISVDGLTYTVRCERQIARGQRDIVATAYDADGSAVAVQEISTAAARSYLDRDVDAAPASWEELERIAVDLLRVQIM